MDIGPVAVEQGLQLADRDRPAEDEALDIGEAGFAGVAQLFLGLDPLSHRLHLQRAGQIGDGLGDSAVAGIFADAAHEALIDLDRVELMGAQRAQRGIAGAEIVERQAQADTAQFAEDQMGAAIIFQEDGFGDFQLQPAGL